MVYQSLCLSKPLIEVGSWSLAGPHNLVGFPTFEPGTSKNLEIETARLQLQGRFHS